MPYSINTYLRKESITLGLEPPHDQCECAVCKQASDTPTLLELDLAARKHRWAEMRKLEVNFFNAFMDQVTEYEEKSLEIFDLPDINVIRESIITGNSDYPGVFTVDNDEIKRYKKILSDWQEQLIGDRTIEKQIEEEESIYAYYMFVAYTIGLENTKDLAWQNASEAIRPFIDEFTIPPDANNEYLKAVKANGLKRIKTKMAEDYKDGVISWLKIMAREGHNPLYVGRWLHREFEGKAWYWNRLARSESVLALNASYDSWSSAAGAVYDKWSAAGGACPICVAFDGQLWRRGEGPEPVTSTHPHCRCVRVPQWDTQGSRVNQRWTRPTPYEQPYNIQGGTVLDFEGLFN